MSCFVGSRQQRKKRQSADTETITINDENLEFTLGFRLDGVPSFQDLEKVFSFAVSLQTSENALRIF